MTEPQVVWIALATAGVFLSLVKHGDYARVNFFVTLVSTGLSFALLKWGGFF